MGGMGAMGGMAGMGAPGMEGLGGAAGQTYKIVGTVDWNPQDQQRIRGEFYFSSRPSSARVRLAQEDYWVYQALLNIIKKTNGNASTHSAVAVKQINSVQIGQRGRKRHRHGPKLGLRRRGRWHGHGRRPANGAMPAARCPAWLRPAAGRCRARGPNPAWAPAWLRPAAGRCRARGPDPAWACLPRAAWGWKAA